MERGPRETFWGPFSLGGSMAFFLTKPVGWFGIYIGIIYRDYNIYRV